MNSFSLEALSLGSLLVGGHSGHNSFTGPFAGTGRFGCAGAPPRAAPREAWEVRRVSADFFGPRLIPAEPFFAL